jgi:hypothetical protein
MTDLQNVERVDKNGNRLDLNAFINTIEKGGNHDFRFIA